MVNLSRGLADRGHAVDLVLLSATGPFLSEVGPNVRLVDLQARRAVSGLPALVRYIRRERPDSMLSRIHYANVTAIVARRIARVRFRLLVLEDNTLTQFFQPTRTMKFRVLLRLMRWTYRWADLVLAVSREAAEDLEQNRIAPPQSVQVVDNPILTPEVYKQMREKPDHPWYHPKRQAILIGVGSLTEQKDFFTLIRAIKRVRDNRDCRLIILGEGCQRAELELLVKSLELQGQVDMPGFVENPHAYFAASDAFVLSSRWEGFGMVLIEALAAGIPIVSTDCPGRPFELLGGGKYGRLVPVGDESRMADAIQDALRDPIDKEALREGARGYDLCSVTEQYHNLLLRDL